ncbi:MAG: 2-oxo acid dehydrogenase subunit E2 [Rickettsiales bacterium]|nr:2-oxo acid dehydrogenase subunit E2 [Pseudomonadota bacterium]MDA0965611.1 2-oxo acid dehydrogenase subunit E2 [Pseudomonadota bacterium]MDG4542935.1 2-oxo acid dehydrogenase subunit E2 [Rickettsiales bacterium]MDG4544617.1 2-oxo acid dehydrogenase subunit E2 [Rickettsiales bacterium]MDG4546739.1 2-oxo acid dehydrogenase subunit E2 [Rickettsiales bacterium]
MTEVLLYAPQLGEGIKNLKVAHIHKNSGDNVLSDEVLLSVETDKALVDIESPSSGFIKSIYCKVGDTVDIGKLLIKIESEKNNEESTLCMSNPVISGAEPSFPVLVSDRDNTSIVGLSPRIIGYCRRNNIPINSLKQIEGTGEDGRIRLQDVISFVNKLPSLKQIKAHTASLAPAWLKESIESEALDLSFKTVLISKTQKQLNFAITRSLTVPQASVSVSAELPDKPLAFIVESIVKVSQKFEKLRAEYVDENTMKIHNTCSIGCAVALPDDNITTVVYDASLHFEKEEFMKHLILEVNQIRRQKQPKEIIKRHSVSISDMSGFGVEDASPFVVSPAIATLFIGSKSISGLSKLTLAFDHRVMNGAYAARILKAIKLYQKHKNSDSITY